ncbi:MAG TPA: outer membrane protein transport protein, partial [Gemmatimonadales bacterium]|nr:outer membrane protein transport protein [Gemmatimonadales bacterium]
MRRFAFLLVACAPAVLGAQGFGVYELSTCTMGRAGAVAANPCGDGSAIFFNPAGLTALNGTHISVGGTLIAPTGGFTDDLFGQKTNMTKQTFLVPNIFVTHRFSPKLSAGIGLYVPYGLGTEWPTTFAGRFEGYKTTLKSMYIQPTVAYQVTPRLSFGLGVSYVHSSVELHQRLDLSAQPLPAALDIAAGFPLGTTFAQTGIPNGTDFADANLSAKGNGVSFNGGVTFKVTDRLTLGGHFMTKTTIHFTGTAAFSQILTGLVLPPGATPLNPSTPLPLDLLTLSQFAPDSALGGGPASTDVVLPDQGSIGLSYKLSDSWSVSADYQQVVWGWFNKLQVNFANPLTPPLSAYEGYRDSNAFRIGTEYTYSPRVTLRGGFLHHSAAAPDVTVTPRLPEGDRNEFVLGAGIGLSGMLH